RQLVEAFRIVHGKHPQTRLVAAGYLGPRDKAYFDEVAKSAVDLGDAFHYAGSPPGHAEKVQFLKSLDVLSVPTVYREPKGLYVLRDAPDAVVASMSKSPPLLAYGLSAVLVVVSATSPASAENWPRFRGPTGMGITSERDLPLTWGGNDNESVLWKAPLPGLA